MRIGVVQNNKESHCSREKNASIAPARKTKERSRPADPKEDRASQDLQRHGRNEILDSCGTEKNVLALKIVAF
jgi:hypothetical protein